MSTQHGAENSLGLYRKSSVIRGPNSPPLIDWTFNDILRSNCGTNPAGTAVISQQQNRTLTYHQLDDRSSRLAHGLYKLGVRRGSRVAVMLGNRLEYVEVRSP